MHFSDPLWLWGLCIVPLVVLAYFFFYRVGHGSKQLQTYIDAHLLPHLLVHKEAHASYWKQLLLWAIVYSCLIVALAGPRWNYREVEMGSTDSALVILLDLSESMNAVDIKPSRLVRAKQRIEDFLLSKRVKIGLVAFAADPHMISPITEDKETIRHMLPSLNTDLVHVQGSRLIPALKMAAVMLEAEPGQNKAIAILSDGGFEDTAAIAEAKQLADRGITIHAIGMGTDQGALLYDRQGNVLKKSGTPIISKISRAPMEELCRKGNGNYIEYNHKEQSILEALEKKATAVEMGKKMRFWDEGFLWFLLPAVPFILWWFRKGAFFFAAIACFSCLEGRNYFKNSEELGKEALDQEEYVSAAELFQDPYRKGVASYKAGNFAEAEKLFQQSVREEVACDAAYNLGNALAQQQKFQEAVTAYEEVLKKWPDHQKAQENLALIKKLLDQQKQEQKQESSQDQTAQSSDEKKEEGQSNRETAQSSDEKKEEDQNNREIAQSSEGKKEKTQEDRDADVLLNRLSDDAKTFLKNKFYIESKKNGTKEGIDPW